MRSLACHSYLSRFFLKNSTFLEGKSERREIAIIVAHSRHPVNNHLVLGHCLLGIPERRVLINVPKSESRSSVKSRPYPLFIRFFAGHISAFSFIWETAREVKFNLSICIRAEIKSIRLPRVVASVCYCFFLNPEELALHHPEAIRSVEIS